MQAGLLDLNDGASRVGQSQIFLVQRARESKELVASVLVEATGNLPVKHLRAATSHFHRAGGQTLRHLPDAIVLQAPRPEVSDHPWRAQRVDELAHDVTRRAGTLCETAAKRSHRACRAGVSWGQPVQAVERVAEPRTPADV